MSSLLCQLSYLAIYCPSERQNINTRTCFCQLIHKGRRAIRLATARGEPRRLGSQPSS